MIKLLFIIISIFLITTKLGVATTQVKHSNPIYYQIVKNNPKIDRKYAMKLSNVIYHVAMLYEIDPRKYAAILAQESMYKLKAHNAISKDYGIAQINHKIAEAYGFDKVRLTTDLLYSIQAGAIVLADFKRMYGEKDLEYWTRYNSSNKKKRKKYKTMVARYL